MAEVTYTLNALVCLVCAVLLLLGWRRSGARLLMWSGACFAVLTINNVVLFIDELVVPDTDLSLVRAGSALVGFGILLYGMIWEA